MLHVSNRNAIIVGAVAFLSLLFTLPNFFSKETVAGWPDWLPKQQMPLGLDLRGGAHLLLAMNTDELRADWLQTLREDARKQLRDAKIAFSAIGSQGGSVIVRLAKPEDSDAALKALTNLVQQIGDPLFGSSGKDITVTRSEPGVIAIAPTEQGFTNRLAGAASAAVETVRRRVNSLGTTEATVVRQGRDRILVQYPGIEDVQKLKDLIGKTAKLTFHSVHPSVSADEAAQTRPPSGYKTYPSEEEANVSYLLQETPVVSGEDLVDAQPGFDPRTNEPVINFRFDQTGARKFGRFTQDNVGAPFAIVLDGKVLSAPVIREAILGGSGQISGSFTVETANNLAVQLRSGALPASLEFIEERTVGPTLGADSIEAGKVAFVIGMAGVTLFLVASYGLFGLFAILALVINLALVIAALSLLQATLTLPGIAGLVLTMGMSVDANVLINERIRDEIRNGKTPIAALDAGFSRAYGTIFDTNMTGILAAAILFFLGSGPIKGFAVTFGLGIIASAFTATTITRYLVAYWVRYTRPKEITI